MQAEELEQAQIEYEDAYSEESDEQMSAPIDGLGQMLREVFGESARNRREAEQNWVKDLRQYNGEYDEDDEPTEGSEAFIRETRTKVKSADARMMDMLFPGGNENNWRIDATKEPNLSEEVVKQIIYSLAVEKIEGYVALIEGSGMTIEQIGEGIEAGEIMDISAAVQMMQEGMIPQEFQPTDDEIKAAVNDDAEERARFMSDEIEDQLSEGRYRREIKKVIHSGNLYGTGWFKGPLVDYRKVTSWKQEEGQWVVESRDIPRPYFEFKPIWDVYPVDIAVSDISESEGYFERYLMAKGDVRALGRRDDFDQKRINEYLRSFPKGDALEYYEFESDLRDSNKDDQGQVRHRKDRKYEVIEYTGWVDGSELVELGLEVDEDAEYRANVWVLGKIVIKATLHPYDDDTVNTLHRYVFEEDETSIFGTGIARLMRDPQRMFNAAIRAMIDNMADAAGGIYDVNVDLLDPSELETIDDMRAKKVVLRTGTGPEAQYPAVRIVETSSRIGEFITLANLARDLEDESTSMPRYTGGENVKGGAAGTAHGLSMLMQQSNIVIKEPVANYDEGITKPFMRGMYHWNMQFSEREDIKGDFEIKATGSTSLIMKEIRANSIEAFAQSTKDPIDGPWIKRGEMNRERAKVRDLDPDQFVYSEDEFKENQRKMMEQASSVEASAMPPEEIAA